MHHYIPLEFGKSWEGAPRDELFEQLNAIIIELKQQLHNDIRESATETSRLRNAVDVHVVVTKVKEARLRKMAQELDELKKGLENATTHRDKAESAMNTAKAERCDREALLQPGLIEAIRKDVQRIGTISVEDLIAATSALSRSAPAISSCIIYFRSELINRFLELRPPTIIPSTETSAATDQDSQNENLLKKRFWGRWLKLDSHREKVEELIRYEFRDLQNKLDGYWTDDYYFDSSFFEDMRLLRRDLQDAANTVGKHAIKIWTQQSDQRISAIMKERDEAGARAESMKFALEDEHKKCTGIQDAVVDHERKRAAFISEMDEAQESGSRFIRFLNEEYLNETRQRRFDLAKTRDATFSFIHLLAAFQLSETHRSIVPRDP